MGNRMSSGIMAAARIEVLQPAQWWHWFNQIHFLSFPTRTMQTASLCTSISRRWWWRAQAGEFPWKLLFLKCPIQIFKSDLPGCCSLPDYKNGLSSLMHWWAAEQVSLRTLEVFAWAICSNQTVCIVMFSWSPWVGSGNCLLPGMLWYLA